MVPKAVKGRSFRGAGLYYLHDKRLEGEEERLTSGRVEFTHTENLPTDDPEKALAWMAYTAMHQGDLKRASGQVKTGRKLTYPVYTYSLSWHPEVTPPTRKEMIAAARQTLKMLGLQRHEVLMVAHNDTDHPHIHVICNRVNPETGIAAPLGNDYLVFSKWAEDHERRTGKIFCRARVFNNAARANGRFVRDTNSLSKAEYLRLHRERAARAFTQHFARAAPPPDLQKFLGQQHDQQRTQLKQEKESQVSAVREGVREEYRPQWRKLYGQQRTEQAKLTRHCESAQKRLHYWLSNKNIDRYGGSREKRAGHLSRAFAYVNLTTVRRRELTATQAQERAKLSAKQRKEVRAKTKTINERYKSDLDKLKQKQASERATMQEALQQIFQRAARVAPVKEQVNEPVKEQPAADQNLTPQQQAVLDLMRAAGREITTKQPEKTRQKLNPEQQAFLDKLQETGRDITTPSAKTKAKPEPTPAESQRALKQIFETIAQITRPGTEQTAPQKTTPEQTPRDKDEERRATAKDITEPATPQTPVPLSELVRVFAEATMPREEKERARTTAGDKSPEQTRQEPREDERTRIRREFQQTAADITSDTDTPASELDELAEALKRRARDKEHDRDREQKRGPGKDSDHDRGR